MTADIARQISSLRELSYEQQGPSRLIIDCVLVADDVGAAHGGEDPHLIETVDHLFAASPHLDALHRINLSVLLALDLVDAGKGSLPHLRNYLEILHFVN